VKTSKTTIGKILNKSHSMFAAAIVRDISEGGDGTQYFGSLMGWSFYRKYAEDVGWINSQGELTDIGKIVGEKCRKIPKNRAYFWAWEYTSAVSEAYGGDVIWE
jgi:hypothetical protein